MSTQKESWRPRAVRVPKNQMDMNLSSALENKDGYWLWSPVIITPLQYPCLENPMDRGAWWAADHGVVRVGHS